MFIVELFRIPRMTGFMACPGAHWQEMQDLGRAFGWKPMGPRLDSVTPQLGSGVLNMAETPAECYCPGTWGNPLPMVLAEDASAWAVALERALAHMEAMKVDLPQPDTMVFNLGDYAEMNELANAGVTRQAIRTFIAFIEKGPFGFAWDD